MTEPVLGEAHRLHHAVGRGDVERELLVAWTSSRVTVASSSGPGGVGAGRVGTRLDRPPRSRLVAAVRTAASGLLRIALLVAVAPPSLGAFVLVVVLVLDSSSSMSVGAMPLATIGARCRARSRRSRCRRRRRSPTIVPKMPAVVTISSPTSSGCISACCACGLRCCGRITGSRRHADQQERQERHERVPPGSAGRGWRASRDLRSEGDRGSLPAPRPTAAGCPGAATPRWRYARSVATRPRGVRWRNPSCSR